MVYSPDRRATNRNARTISLHVDGDVVKRLDTFAGPGQRFPNRSAAAEEAFRLAVRWWAAEEAAKEPDDAAA